MLNYSATYTDQYQLTMSQVYYQKGHKDHKAVFDYFFRRLPFGSGYGVFAGLEELLNILENLRFSPKDLEFLKEKGFAQDFVDHLKDFRFSGNIYAAREGDLVFPTRPVLQVEATIIEAQIIETLLLNLLNFQTLIATKASRMRQVAGDKMLIDFGLRRAQGPGGYAASRAAFIGGFDGTSNVVAGKDYDIPISGTMAHSYIQSYEDELTAFKDFAQSHPNNCILLVDTYDTLKSGIPNAITVGKEMEKAGNRLKGIRLDSGDLAYLARQSRRMLDEAGLSYVKISASNQLDEFVIKSLQEQGAPIDIYGVGTNLVIGKPDGALDGVYKLSHFMGKPRIKLSDSIGKITIPHKKQVYRLIAGNGDWIGADAIAMHDEQDFSAMHDVFDPLKSMSIKDLKREPLLEKVMENGTRTSKSRSLKEIAEYCRNRLAKLPAEYKRFENPHIYKIGITDRLKEERDRLIEEHRK